MGGTPMNFPVDWAQTFAIIGSMLAVWYAFYQITDKRIDRMETHHREDMKLIHEDMKLIRNKVTSPGPMMGTAMRLKIW